MLALPASVRVYLASEPVDMRRGHDGLFEISTEFTSQLEPLVSARSRGGLQ